MKGRRILNSGSKKVISKMATQRTADRAAAIHHIIDLPTLTLAKGAAVRSEAIHTNLRTIETGSRVVDSDPLIFLLAENTRGHGLHLRTDPARPPPNTVYRHVRISLLTTCGGQPGIGVVIIILATSLATDTTVQMTHPRIVTTAPKEIHGGHHMIIGQGHPHPLLLDPLEWTMLQLLLALTVFPMACTPLLHHPQTPLPLPLRNDPCLLSISRYLSPFPRRSRRPPSSAGPPHRSILRWPPRMYQRLTQVL